MPQFSAQSSQRVLLASVQRVHLRPHDFRELRKGLRHQRPSGVRCRRVFRVSSSSVLRTANPRFSRFRLTIVTLLAPDEIFLPTVASGSGPRNSSASSARNWLMLSPRRASIRLNMLSSVFCARVRFK